MKHTLFIFFLCCFVGINHSQNLVINGDFELYDSCPTSIGSVNGFVQDVYNPQTSGTADYFNSCAEPLNNCLNPGSCSIPENFFGFQHPLSGNGMMGHFVSYTIENYHEYFVCKLSQTLKKDSLYEISCNVVRANHCKYATDNYMVAFTQNPVPMNNMTFQTLSLNGFNINHTGFIKDTLKWTKLRHYYKANGTENYLVFGSFLENEFVSTILIEGNVLFCPDQLTMDIGSYYYVDAVSIEKQSEVTFFPNVFSPNNDGINDTFESLVSGYKLIGLRIINRWGETVFSTNDSKEEWNGEFADKSCNEGVYFYYAIFLDEEINQELIKQGSVTLMR